MKKTGSRAQVRPFALNAPDRRHHHLLVIYFYMDIHLDFDLAPDLLLNCYRLIQLRLLLLSLSDLCRSRLWRFIVIVVVAEVKYQTYRYQTTYHYQSDITKSFLHSLTLR